ncbi:flagellar biosynthesis regulator FlaF [Microvirga arsenatis]|uniref:Flagellar biosynthesis regulator FlaF n=1 Tax=Microvirga arsenatis TaxID=2692265 RepID=A0ABW9YY17_9HYPH|nr:flagellar biosynthesis regulator FlaF [Microvirga arsenatis]NBJ11025.1 flagellar biosynthesis regulator FlaF [Microvirga arsenatis]NBJ25298.1 flagellar biosynthesis regulator FlaF [Microvirga arsenatis]
MYRFSYAEVIEDSSRDCRQREYELFDRAIKLMKAAEGMPSQSREMIEAIVFLQRLWTFLIKDLGHPDNGLPDQLKGQLISIGLWVMRESDRVVRGEHNSLEALIDINTMIQEGLK